MPALTVPGREVRSAVVAINCTVSALDQLLLHLAGGTCVDVRACRPRRFRFSQTPVECPFCQFMPGFPLSVGAWCAGETFLALLENNLVTLARNRKTTTTRNRPRSRNSLSKRTGLSTLLRGNFEKSGMTRRRNDGALLANTQRGIMRTFFTFSVPVLYSQSKVRR